MNLSSHCIRTALKQKLKDRYEHLTDEDLAELQEFPKDWVWRLHRRVGGSLFELAHLVEETALELGLASVWTPRKSHERSCA